MSDCINCAAPTYYPLILSSVNGECVIVEYPLSAACCPVSGISVVPYHQTVSLPLIDPLPFPYPIPTPGWPHAPGNPIGGGVPFGGGPFGGGGNTIGLASGPFIESPSLSIGTPVVVSGSVSAMTIVSYGGMDVLYSDNIGNTTLHYQDKNRIATYVGPASAVVVSSDEYYGNLILNVSSVNGIARPGSNLIMTPSAISMHTNQGYAGGGSIGELFRVDTSANTVSNYGVINEGKHVVTVEYYDANMGAGPEGGGLSSVSGSMEGVNPGNSNEGNAYFWGSALDVSSHIAVNGGYITKIDIRDNALTSGHMASNSITTAKITDLNVTTGKLADLSVTTGKLADLSVTTAKLAASSVTTAKLDGRCVTAAKIASDVIGVGLRQALGGEIGVMTDDVTITVGVDGLTVIDGSIGSTQLADLSVTTGKLADNAVTTVKITDLNVTTGKLADLSVTAGKLASDSVTTIKITDLNVTTGKLADLSVTAGKLASDSVTTIKILDANVTSAKLASGIDATKIADGTVTSTEFQYINTVSSNVQTQLNTKISNTDFSWTPFEGFRQFRDNHTGTLAITDYSIDSATSANGWTPVINMADTSSIRVGLASLIPAELDTTQAVSIKIYWRNSGAGVNGLNVRLGINMRNVPDSANLTTGGVTTFTSSLVEVPASKASGDLNVHTFTNVLDTTFLTGGVFMKGVFERIGGGTGDDWTGIFQYIGCQFVGKRKVT